MSALDRSLLPDEQITYRTKKHWIIFTIPVVTLLITLLFLINPNPYVTKVAFFPALAALVVWINTTLNYVTSEFAVTNKRVLMKEGFFVRHMNETRLATISNVNINQSLLGQILNYGTISINTFGGDNDPFSEIAFPIEFQKQLQAQLDNTTRKTI
jgi:uncharacterized membrane protein YdbT with pleckstrin-like domain